MRKREQMKALQNGNGIQYLLDEAFGILGNPLALFYTGSGYNLIAYTDTPVDDPLWKELIETRTFSTETQLFFMQECFTDTIANAQGLAVLKSEQLKYDRVSRHIFNGSGIKVANLSMLEYSIPLDADVLAAFKVLAGLLMEEIREDESYIAFGEAYQTEWIGKLIDKRIGIKALHSSHVQNLYHGFKKNLYLAVVDIARCSVEYKSYQCFVDSLRKRRGDCKYALYDEYIVILMSTNYNTFSIKRELRDLENCFKDENVFAGISSSFENLFDLRRYYDEAMAALRSLDLDGNCHVALFKPVHDR